MTTVEESCLWYACPGKAGISWDLATSTHCRIQFKYLVAHFEDVCKTLIIHYSGNYLIFSSAQFIREMFGNFGKPCFTHGAIFAVLVTVIGALLSGSLLYYVVKR